MKTITPLQIKTFIGQYTVQFICWLALSTFLWRLLSGHWPNADRWLIDVFLFPASIVGGKGTLGKYISRL
jgi:hypothetical protein